MLLMNLKENENLTVVSLPIDTDFVIFRQILQFFIENFNGFKLLNIFTNPPILDV